jgi:DNA-binding NtrC family response regulator
MNGIRQIRRQTEMKNLPRILIVDDEAVIRRGFDRLLSGDHCRTSTANNGAAALNAMVHEPFDVVLLDLRMPGEDGLSVLRKIKAGWPRSEVVVITGFPSIESVKEAVQAGAFDYLAKPVEAEDVLGATRRALSRRRWLLRREQRTRNGGAVAEACFCNKGENHVSAS